MIKQINIHEAKTHFSQLLVDVQSGVEIIIAKAGTPIARLISETKRVPSRKPGSAKKLIGISLDFEAPLPKDIMDSFER